MRNPFVLKNIYILTISVFCRIWQRCRLCKTGPEKTRHLSRYVSIVFMFHSAHRNRHLHYTDG